MEWPELADHRRSSLAQATPIGSARVSITAIETYAHTMVSATERLVESWNAQVDRAGHHDVEIDQAMTDLTLNIICRAMFDTDVSQTSGDIARAVATLSEVAFHEMQSPWIMPNWWPSRFIRQKRWAMQVLDETIWHIVRERRADGRDHGDLLSMLLAAVDEEGDGGRLDDRQVRNEMMTLMLAGHDTTAAAPLGLVQSCASPSLCCQVSCRDRRDHRRSCSHSG